MVDYSRLMGVGQVVAVFVANNTGDPIPGELLNPDTGEALPIDEVSGALITIDYAHHEVHEGSMFVAAYKSPDGADVANDAELRYLFQVGAKACHLDWLVVGGGDLEIFAYESTTFSNAGTSVPAGNMNRTSANVATMTVTHTPTITDNGNQLLNAFIPGGDGNRAVGGLLRGDAEWILAPNTVYYLRCINRSGSAVPIGAIFEWYEKSV